MISLVSINIQKCEQIWRNLHILQLFLAWPLFHIHVTASIATWTSTTSTPTRPTPTTQRRLKESLTSPYGTIFSGWTTDSSWTGFCLGTFPFPRRKAECHHLFKWFPGTNVACVVHSGSAVASDIPSNYSAYISNARSQLPKHLSSQHKSASHKWVVRSIFKVVYVTVFFPNHFHVMFLRWGKLATCEA